MGRFMLVGLEFSETFVQHFLLLIPNYSIGKMSREQFFPIKISHAVHHHKWGNIYAGFFVHINVVGVCVEALDVTLVENCNTMVYLVRLISLHFRRL
jgi:hypothetical protein